MISYVNKANTTEERFYFIKGSVRLTLNGSGIESGTDYYAYSGISRSISNGEQKRYDFTKKERDTETGLNYFGARYYDSEGSFWYSVDPLADKYPGWSPYNYVMNNPLNAIDPNGDSTFVLQNDNGTYKVTGGNLSGADDDTGVYIKNSDGSVTLVGNSVSTHSFFGDDGNAVVGAIINPTSTEGQNFISNEIINGKPNFYSYLANATGGQHYDFKSRGIDSRPAGMTRDAYRYRGSVTSGGLFGSARDFGNIGAGIVAGRARLSWNVARVGFDALESFQKGKFVREGTPTQKAQLIGWKIGRLLKK